MDRKIKIIWVVGFLLIVTIAMPCMGVISYSYSELIEQKNKILESSSTDIVPPGEYTFENAGVVVLGTIPSAKPNLLIEGVPFIKSFLMKLFITGNFGKIFFMFFPFAAILTKNTYTLTLELPKDIPSGNNNTFYLVGVIYLNDGENFSDFSIANQRHTLTVHYKYLEETVSGFFIRTSIVHKTMAFEYLGIYCESVTVNVPE